MASLSAEDIIRLLGLKPHPEGGHFRETFRDTPLSLQATEGRHKGEGDRAASTAIYFLLARGERSHWHRIDAVEIWHFYAGGPLALQFVSSCGRRERLIVGTDLAAGQRPQAIVPAHAWQAAQPLSDWTLVGCTVAPGFEFVKLQLAPMRWEPSI